MKVVFDIEQLKKILSTFYAITNITITLFDSDLNCVAFAGGYQPYCLAIGEDEALHEECAKCNLSHAHEALARRSTLIYTCHAGIVEIVAPIFFHDTIVAYLILGEFRDVEEQYSSDTMIMKAAEKYGLDKDEMLEAYGCLPIIDKKYIDGIIMMLQFCIKYMLFEELLHTSRNPLSPSIDKYIDNHLDERITVESLCKQFNITKNTLYKILRIDFDDTVQNTVNKKRIKRAQEVLQKTNLPIRRIAESVGFNDYSYFSQAFKKSTGMSPLQYRRYASKTYDNDEV